jgi:hypothetical protein
MPQSAIDTNINGRMNRNKDMPADLIATNSKLSPRLPNVIMEEIKMAMGMARVSKDALAYHKNLPMVNRSRSFPTKSSMYFQRLCIIKTKKAIKNVAINGPINDRMISLSNFFIICPNAVGWRFFNVLPLVNFAATKINCSRNMSVTIKRCKI